LVDFVRREVLLWVSFAVVGLSALVFLMAFYLTWQVFRAREVERLHRADRSWSEAVASARKLLGVLSVQLRHLGGRGDVLELLREIHASYSPAVAYAVFASSDGRVVSYPSHDFRPRYDPRGRGWFRAALESPGDSVVIKPFLHEVVGEPAVGVVKAVLGEGGEVLGVLGLDLLVGKAFSADGALPRGALYVLDERGRTIARWGEVGLDPSPEEVDLLRRGEEVLRWRDLRVLVGRPSVAGTHLVVELSLSEGLISSLLVALAVGLGVGGMALSSLRRVEVALGRGIVEPLRGLSEAASHYVGRGRFDPPEVESPVEEVSILSLGLREMMGTIEEQLRLLRDSYDQLERSQQQLEEAFEALRLKEEEVREAYKLFTERLGHLVERFDEPTGAHVRRVRALSAFLASRVGLSPTLVEQIELYAPLHDLGKVMVPREILSKRGPLTPQEFDLVKRHVLWGAELLEGSERLSVAHRIALYHHERYDGSGYWFGLRDDQIPIEAQVVGLADVYDALRSERPYKRGMSHEEAMGVILLGDGRTRPEGFSPTLLGVLRDFSDEVELVWARALRYGP